MISIWFLGTKRLGTTALRICSCKRFMRQGPVISRVWRFQGDPVDNRLRVYLQPFYYFISILYEVIIRWKKVICILIDIVMAYYNIFESCWTSFPGLVVFLKMYWFWCCCWYSLKASGLVRVMVKQPTVDNTASSFIDTKIANERAFWTVFNN